MALKVCDHNSLIKYNEIYKRNFMRYTFCPRLSWKHTYVLRILNYLVRIKVPTN